MKIKNICFSVLLLGSVLVVGFCFRIAVLQRGDAPLGGEVFSIALPLLIWKLKMWAVEQEKATQKRILLLTAEAAKDKDKTIKKLLTKGSLF